MVTSLISPLYRYAVYTSNNKCLLELTSNVKDNCDV